jgi:hypothetical protein
MISTFTMVALFIMAMALAVVVTAIIKSILIQNEDRRKDGRGGCSDCKPDWCPCWEIEQQRRNSRRHTHDNTT